MSVFVSTQSHPAFRNNPVQKLQQPILKLRRCPHSVAATSQLCLLSRKSLSSIETRSLPALTRSYPRHFTFYVAHPIRSIETRSLPTLPRCYRRSFTLIVRTAHVLTPAT